MVGPGRTACLHQNSSGESDPGKGEGSGQRRKEGIELKRGREGRREEEEGREGRVGGARKGRERMIGGGEGKEGRGEGQGRAGKE